MAKSEEQYNCLTPSLWLLWWGLHRVLLQNVSSHFHHGYCHLRNCHHRTCHHGHCLYCQQQTNAGPQSHEQSCSKYLWYFMKNTDSSYPSNNRREWSIFPWWAFVTLARHFPKMEQFTNHKHLHKKLKVNVVRNAISGIWCWEFFFLNR